MSERERVSEGLVGWSMWLWQQLSRLVLIADSAKRNISRPLVQESPKDRPKNVMVSSSERDSAVQVGPPVDTAMDLYTPAGPQSSGTDTAQINYSKKKKRKPRKKATLAGFSIF